MVGCGPLDKGSVIKSVNVFVTCWNQTDCKDKTLSRGLTNFEKRPYSMLWRG